MNDTLTDAKKIRFSRKTKKECTAKVWRKYLKFLNISKPWQSSLAISHQKRKYVFQQCIEFIFGLWALKSNGIKILAFPCDTFESNSGLQPKFHPGLLACQRNYNCQRNPTLCRGLGLEDVSITHAQVKSNPDVPYPCDLDIKLVLVATQCELRPYLLGSFL